MTSGLLAGDADSPANAAIPDSEYAGPTDFSELPGSNGLVVSESNFAVMPALGATVGEVNSLLQDVGAQVVGGLAPRVPTRRGVLLLRLEQASHAAMSALVAALRTSPLVDYATRDYPVKALALPRPSSSHGTCSMASAAECWSWEASAAGGNWGLEQLQVPQAWNLWPHLRNGAWPQVLLMDAGFNAHMDLDFAELRSSTTVLEDLAHGTAVAGVIAAKHNQVGADGIVPTAQVTGVEAAASSSRLFLVQTFRRIEELQPDIVNTSMSQAYPRSALVDSSVQQDLRDAEQMWLENRKALEEADHLSAPFMAFAAGNEGGACVARWTSPGCGVAVQQLAAGVHCVESLEHRGAAGVGQVSSSCDGGTIAAPGELVLTTSFPALYEVYSGTSFASPFLAGQVAYLLTSASLSLAEIDGVLRDPNLTRGAADTGARYLPLYDALLAVDELRSDTTNRRRAMNIDDGTRDGHLRVDVKGETVDADELAQATGPRPDDVNMADFRRWRDWYLLIHRASTHQLDGSPSGDKHDVNGDSSGSPTEDVFPRGDFNGDGKLDLASVRALPGFASPVTDLEVFQTLFVDADYDSADLPGLVESGDVHFYPDKCLALPDVVNARSTIEQAGAPVGNEPTRPFATMDPHIYTLPVGTYTARLEALDGSGAVIASNEREITVGLGSDHHVVGCATHAAWAATNTEEWDYRVGDTAEWIQYQGGYRPADPLPLNDANHAEAFLASPGGDRGFVVDTSAAGFCLQGTMFSVRRDRPFCDAGEPCRHYSDTAGAVVIKPAEMGIDASSTLEVFMDDTLSGGSLPCGGSSLYSEVFVYDVETQQFLARIDVAHEQYPPDAASRYWAVTQNSLGWVAPADDATHVTLPFDVSAYETILVQANTFGEVDCDDGRAAAAMQVNFGGVCGALPAVP